jgi:hypothetical protein
VFEDVDLGLGCALGGMNLLGNRWGIEALERLGR